MIDKGIIIWEHIVAIVVVLVLISFIIWLIVNTHRKKRARQSPLKKNLELLKEQYARGEINEQEFKDRERKLMQAPTNKEIK